MAAMTSPLRHAQPNRRRRVRHRIQTPAYASFAAESRGAALDLHEIVDICEEGVAIHCVSPLAVEQSVDLCLDLAECPDPIYTTGKVVWVNDAGRAGLRFSELPPASMFRLREWLFLNAMIGMANLPTALPVADFPAPRPDYSDTLNAVTAVQREVETLGADLAAALQLIASRAQTLVHASGAAVALAGSDPEFMECQASAGSMAPPVGARLQVGSGLSGECVQSGRLLRCDDSELDARVDRESCRALGIRSILAAPVRVGDKSIGILETFSAQPNAFSEDDSRVLQRLSETVLAAVNRAARAEDLPPLTAAPSFPPSPGSVLFASTEEESKAEAEKQRLPSAITLPLRHLIIFCLAAVTIATVLGVVSAPWIQSDLMPWVHDKLHVRQSQLPTVLASSRPQAAGAPAVETATIDQLRQLAASGNAAAENALGLRYFQGDGVVKDEHEAFRWFLSSASHGNLAAQSKLGFLYSSGIGVAKDPTKAYYWAVLARARGDESNRELASQLAANLTRAQAATIEQEASNWFLHQSAEPDTGH